MKLSLFAAALVLGTLVLFPLSASADSHEAPAEGAASAATECPELTRIKYPFLKCRTNPWGGVGLASVGVRNEGVSPAVPEFKAWAWSE